MNGIKRLTTAAALAALAALSTGCENSPLSAESDWTIDVLAQPGIVTVDPANGINEGESRIVATILNDKGIPQQGINVVFSNQGGKLKSGASGVKTNAAGQAIDTLTVNANDPAEINVTATSASLSKTVKVTRSTAPVNHPPLASIVASPQDEQASGKAVVFDGSGSLDPDTGDLITMYKWVLTSTNPDSDKPNPMIFEGPAVSGLSFPSEVTTPFQNVQEVTVTLFVTDDPDAPAEFAAGTPIAYPSSQIAPAYQIVAVRCSDNTKPVASIAGSDQQQITGVFGATVNFLLDGTLSSDTETPIETYTWNCGNGSIPLPQGNGSKAVCKYFVDSITRTYSPTLVVTDRGTGQIVNGAFECAKESDPDSIQVSIIPQVGG